MLRKLRLTLAVFFATAITLMFLDITGTLHVWFGWMAKVQFLPAILALNFLVVLALIVFTLIFGRIYCSVICPLGVFQDMVAWFGRKAKKNRYTYSEGKHSEIISFRRAVLAGDLELALITAVFPPAMAAVSTPRESRKGKLYGLMIRDTP